METLKLTFILFSFVIVSSMAHAQQVVSAKTSTQTDIVTEQKSKKLAFCKKLKKQSLKKKYKTCLEELEKGNYEVGTCEEETDCSDNPSEKTQASTKDGNKKDQKNGKDPAIVGPVQKDSTGIKSFRKITKKATRSSSSKKETQNISEEEEELARMEIFDYGAAAIEMAESSSPMVSGTSVSPKETEMAFHPAGGDQRGVNLESTEGKEAEVGEIVIAGLKKSNPQAMSAIESLYKEHSVDHPSMSPSEFVEHFEESMGREPTTEEKETHAAFADARNTTIKTKPHRDVASVNQRDMTHKGLFDPSNPEATLFVPDGEVQRGHYRTGRQYQENQRGRRVEK